MTHDLKEFDFDPVVNFMEFEDSDYTSLDEAEDEEYDSIELGKPRKAALNKGDAEDAMNDAPKDKLSLLFNSMKGQRKTLLAVLRACENPQSAEFAIDMIENLRNHNFSVYGAAEICALLSDSDAIERVTAEGVPIKDFRQEPEHVFVDGVEFLKPRDTPETYWQTTEKGMKQVRSDDPLSRLKELFDRDAEFLPIYRQILEMCLSEGGCKAAEINAAVNGDPLLREANLFAPHFVELLEKNCALDWRGSWTTTDEGQQALSLIESLKV